MVFAFPFSLQLMQLLDDAAPRRPPTPTAHQTTYIPNSTHDEVHYVQHCSRICGRFWPLLVFLAFMRRQHHHGLPCWFSPWWAVVLAHEKNKHAVSFGSLYFFHYRSSHRPLNLTPTARSGCGLHSLVTTIKRRRLQEKNDVFGFVLWTRRTPCPAPL